MVIFKLTFLYVVRVFDGFVKCIEDMRDFLVGRGSVFLAAGAVVAATKETEKASVVVLYKLLCRDIAMLANVPDLELGIDLPDPIEEVFLEFGMDGDVFLVAFFGVFGVFLILDRRFNLHIRG